MTYIETSPCFFNPVPFDFALLKFINFKVTILLLISKHRIASWLRWSPTNPRDPVTDVGVFFRLRKHASKFLRKIFIISSVFFKFSIRKLCTYAYIYFSTKKNNSNLLFFLNQHTWIICNSRKWSKGYPCILIWSLYSVFLIQIRKKCRDWSSKKYESYTFFYSGP